MIRAAALSYAVVFSLLVGLICSGVLFITSAQKRIEVLQTNKEHVLFDSYAAIRYGVDLLNPGDSATYLHSNGDTSVILHRRWGAFSMVSSRTHKYPDEQYRTALVGGIHSPVLPCLYLPGNTGELKITGTTRIEGEAIVPNGKVERAYIAGKNYAFDQLVFGKISVAKTGLPALKKGWQNLDPKTVAGTLMPRDFVPHDSSYSFHLPTAYFSSLAPLLLVNNIRGNAIIRSFDSIFVDARAHLENVILIAPVVRFGAGFTGKVQVLANERVVCEKGVQLQYPSTIVLNELELRSELTRREVVLEEGASVLGGILITSRQPDFRKPTILELREGSVAAGLIWNGGESEVKGAVIGHLYTERLLARAGGGTYGNHLVDALISSRRLPEHFLLPDWLEAQSEIRSKVIAWL